MIDRDTDQYSSWLISVNSRGSIFDIKTYKVLDSRSNFRTHCGAHVKCESILNQTKPMISVDLQSRVGTAMDREVNLMSL